MEWTALLATGTGALLALSGTVVADVIRSRRDRGHGDESQRRADYVDFLVALSSTHGRLRAIARQGLDGRALHVASREVIGETGLHLAYEKLLISAPVVVGGACETVLLRLRKVRDAIGAGAKLNDRTYHDAFHPLQEAVWQLRSTFRTDLGRDAYTTDDLGLADLSGLSGCVVCAGSTG